MPDFVFKTTPKGYSVKDAADWQLSASSFAPLLKIARNPDGTPMMGSFTVPDTSADYLIKSHNLGYVPIFFVFDNSNWQFSDGTEDRDDGGNEGACRMISTGVSQFIGMNSTGLYWQGGSRSAYAGTLTGYYYIFQELMLEDFVSEISGTTPTSGGLGEDNYLLKITKPGADITSEDFRDFNFHSGCRSPQIYKKKAATGWDGMGLITVPHDLGYPPMCFAWAKLSAFGDGMYQPVFTAGDALVVAGNDDCQFGIPYECDYALLILKDPSLLV